MNNFIGQMVATNDFQKTQLTKKRETDAGLDIRSSIDITVPAKSRVAISTDLYARVPKGCVGLIWSRSGLSLKHGLEVGAGCIDHEYTGEIVVILYNHSKMDFDIKTGDRIAQLLTIPVVLNNYESVQTLEETDRGEKGFGSSQLK